MKSKGLLFIGVIVVVLIVIWGLSDVGIQIIVRYGGQKIRATVVNVPMVCDKYNHIVVLYEGRDYEVSISKSDCRDGVYRTGQSVVLLKHKRYEELVWPESQPGLAMLIILAALAFAFFGFRSAYKAKETRYALKTHKNEKISTSKGK